MDQSIVHHKTPSKMLAKLEAVLIADSHNFELAGARKKHANIRHKPWFLEFILSWAPSQDVGSLCLSGPWAPRDGGLPQNTTEARPGLHSLSLSRTDSGRTRLSAGQVRLERLDPPNPQIGADWA